MENTQNDLFESLALEEIREDRDLFQVSAFDFICQWFEAILDTFFPTQE